MNKSVLHTLHALFPAPNYLSLNTAGIDISTSGIKFVILERKIEGLVISSFGSLPLPEGVIESGDIVNTDVFHTTLKQLVATYHLQSANIALPEQRSYIFEVGLPYAPDMNIHDALGQVIAQEVPLPPQETRFGALPLAREGAVQHVAGVAYARRVIAEYRDNVIGAGVLLRGMESEMHALPRALLSAGDTTTCMIVDFGKTTTKIMIVQDGKYPLFATTLDIGGGALTAAVQKYFGVTEDEALIIKREKGIIPEEVGDEYLAAMLSTVSAMRDEITNRFEYWQKRAAEETILKPIERVLLTGGSANIRGLPEYFSASLGVPVAMGNPFVNLAPFAKRVPPIEYEQSLSYSTAIGLTLRDHLYD